MPSAKLPHPLRAKTPQGLRAPTEPVVPPVLNAAPDTGLTHAQAAERAAAGLDNRVVDEPVRSVGQILRENVFTFFNLVFVVLAACLFSVGSWLNAGFLGVVVCNTAIGVVQQLRARAAIQKLTLLSAHKVRCVRDGRVLLLPAEELVRDDIVEFTAGEQICADAVVRRGEASANESLVTGEAVPVPKRPGDALRSGSFLTAGHCRAQLTRVGADSYANRLAAQAKADHRFPKGEMLRMLDKLIRAIGLALVPVGVVMFVKQYAFLHMPLRGAVEGTVASLVGMIPEGLYLLTSVALALGVLRLARRRVLAQDMNCIETLARVDVLCVDKTGTITENRMEAAAPRPLDPDAGQAYIQTVLRSFYTDAEPDNDTARALQRRFAGAGERWPRTAAIPFDPARKWSAAAFGPHGAFVIGAPEFVAGPRAGELSAAMAPCVQGGGRVLVLARYDGRPSPNRPLDPDRLHFLALLPIVNRIRAEAPGTFRFFAEQGVAVKVISGDNPAAVSEVARRAGIPGAENYVDASTLRTDAQLADAAERCTVFGRVTPDQKRTLVQALQSGGHTVAMTGDGVNDVLALTQADCGIAMASGAQAAGQVAQLVLLDSDFSALPAVVAEGRRVINNIQRSAALFLVKNIFSFTLSMVTLFLAVPYPLQPIQLTLVSAVTIGIPSFVLALEPNHELVRGRFLPNVLRAALPGGLTDFVLVLAAQAAATAWGLSHRAVCTVVALVLLGGGLAVLWRVCRPFTRMHAALWGGMLALGAACALFLGDWIGFVALDARGWGLLLLLWALTPWVLRLFTAGVRAGGSLWRRRNGKG